MSGINPGENAMSKKVVDKQTEHPQGSEEVLDGSSTDQKTTPDHGYDAVEWSGVVSATAESTGGGVASAELTASNDDAQAESILLERLRQVVDDTSLIGSQKIILAVILFRSKDNGNCQLTYEEIAALTALSRRVVAKYVPLLEKSGWIERERISMNYIYRYIKDKK